MESNKDVTGIHFGLTQVLSTFLITHKMKGATEFRLSSGEESENEAEVAPDRFEVTLQEDQGWKDMETTVVPPTSINNIHQYFTIPP